MIKGGLENMKQVVLQEWTKSIQGLVHPLVQSREVQKNSSTNGAKLCTALEIVPSVKYTLAIVEKFDCAAIFHWTASNHIWGMWRSNRVLFLTNLLEMQTFINSKRHLNNQSSVLSRVHLHTLMLDNIPCSTARTKHSCIINQVHLSFRLFD